MDKNQKIIITKLFYENCWGKHHLTENTILKGNKRSNHGDLKKALAELVKKKYIVKIPHHPDNAYHLNPELSEEIHEIMYSS